MPCWELFDRQPQRVPRRGAPAGGEGPRRHRAGIDLGWDRYVGDAGAVVGMHTFGASAPLKQLLDKFGFTPDRVAEVARECLEAVRTEGR